MHPTIKPENPLHLPPQKLLLGCPLLDRLLHGGITVGSVTEPSGESGSGKTQLALQILSPPSSPLPLSPLSSSTPSSHSLSAAAKPSPHPNPLDHIFIRGVHSPADLLSLLPHVDRLLSRPPSSLPIRLIIIDSVVALFRSEFDCNPSDIKRRSNLLFRVASKLKEKAKDFNLAVVLTNQVLDAVGSEEGKNYLRVGNFKEFWSSGRRVWPALGLSWANCVNTRLFLSRREEIGRREEEEGLECGGLGRTKRMIQVVIAPHLPESSSEFVIVKEGVFGVSL